MYKYLYTYLSGNVAMLLHRVLLVGHSRHLPSRPSNRAFLFAPYRSSKSSGTGSTLSAGTGSTLPAGAGSTSSTVKPYRELLCQKSKRQQAKTESMFVKLIITKINYTCSTSFRKLPRKQRHWEFKHQGTNSSLNIIHRVSSRAIVSGYV